MDKRNAKLSEIKVWYKFRPSIDVWTGTGHKGKTSMIPLHDETWYDGYPFNTGYFFFIQVYLFSIHIKLRWWKIRLK